MTGVVVVRVLEWFTAKFRREAQNIIIPASLAHNGSFGDVKDLLSDT